MNQTDRTRCIGTITVSTDMIGKFLCQGSTADNNWIRFIGLLERRDDFMRHMEGCNVMVSRVHERNDKHSCVAEFAAPLPNLHILVSEMICIPNGWWISAEDRQYVLECIQKGW